MTDRLPTHLLWLDFETTGLNPAKDLVLEVAAVLTTADPLEEVWHGEWLIYHPDVTIQRLANMPEVVRRMHDKSGLLRDYMDALCAGELVQPGRVTDAIAVAVKDHSGPGSVGGVPALAGAGADHMERLWLSHGHLDDILRWVRYWSIDPSEMRRSIELWGYTWPREPVAHRALADCSQAIDEWRRLRAVFDDGQAALLDRGGRPLARAAEQ